MVVETEQVTMRQSDLYCGENNQSTDEVNIQLKKKRVLKNVMIMSQMIQAIFKVVGYNLNQNRARNKNETPNPESVEKCRLTSRK